jgi:Co/Zn/Cd efflux system component
VLPSILSNPSHALTLVVSLLLLLVPLISLSHSTSLDIIIAISTALAMITIGVRLVKVLGSMLLMSYGPDVQKVIDEIAKDPNVREIQEARFWQVHHGLCIATLRLVVGDCEVSRIKEMVGRLVRERMGGGPGGKRWEVSVVVTTTS